MIRIIFILLFVVNSTIYSQNNCNCNETLNKLIIKVEKEYPGFQDKTKDSILYNNYKKQLLEISMTTSNESCIDILQKYTAYFRSSHLSISKLNATLPTVSKDLIVKDAIEVDIANFNKYVENSKDSLEGIWTSGSYKVGIIKKANSYNGFIISSQNESWKPSDVKFKLEQDGKAVYYMGDHSQNANTFSVVKNSILFFNNTKVAFIKEFPSPPFTKEEIEAEVNKLEGFYLKPNSDKTLYLKIAGFDPAYTARIEKLIESSKTLLKSYKNLIIDVRGNGGGSDYSWHPLRPYLYTNQVRGLGAEYLVTQTLIDGLTNWANNADKEKYADEIEKVKRDVNRMKGKLGEFIPTSEEGNAGFFTLDSVYQNPKSVVILVDKDCGSSTEQFLLHAKQSKKVKVFGTPTYGVLDYSSVRRFDFECSGYVLMMPTFRVMRLPDYPLDNIGIQPDVFMDKYIGDWIKYATEYLENKNIQ
ncbi:MAG: hypothetical protein CVU00_13410 [Bacteroidetes bacterium HGW-Bacteroidetes-17]|jgi:hypothetical protein|nr:MAG: hypothetical protein CVU00_13410 [Bacteroidetes bacterium HGW-Bacteroidetes-17]